MLCLRRFVSLDKLYRVLNMSFRSKIFEGLLLTSELEDLEQIGRLLKAARKELGYSQQKVAEIAGISRLRYHDIEAGRSAARITTLMSIARALKLELMFVPKVWVPAVNGLLRPHDIIDGSDTDAFTFESDIGSQS